MQTKANRPPVLSPDERRARNREEMRRAILEAARGVMRDQGVAALSLREVARQVRMQAPSLYAYFPSKMALYDALFLEGIYLFVAYRDVDDQADGDFWRRLHARLESYMRFAQENPDLYQLVFERPVPGFIPSEASMAESRRQLAGFEQTLNQAVDEGQIVLDIPVSQARDLIIAVMHGLTSQHMSNEPNLPIGSGRYGSLIPAALALFQAAWCPEVPASRGGDAGGDGERRHHTKGGGRTPDLTGI